MCSKQKEILLKFLPFKNLRDDIYNFLFGFFFLGVLSGDALALFKDDS